MSADPIQIDWAEVAGAFRRLTYLSHDNSRTHGFWDNIQNVPEKFCLMHSEISEALEEYRDKHPLTAIRINMDDAGKPEGIPIELADLLIRVFDFCGGYGINLAEAVKMKIVYNATRAHKHGGKVC